MAQYIILRLAHASFTYISFLIIENLAISLHIHTKRLVTLYTCTELKQPIILTAVHDRQTC